MATRLDKIMQDNQINNTQLSELSGVSRATILNIREGTNVPGLITVIKLKKALKQLNIEVKNSDFIE